MLETGWKVPGAGFEPAKHYAEELESTPLTTRVPRLLDWP